MAVGAPRTKSWAGGPWVLWGVVRRREIERGQRAGHQGRNWGHFKGLTWAQESR